MVVTLSAIKDPYLRIPAVWFVYGCIPIRLLLGLALIVRRELHLPISNEVLRQSLVVLCVATVIGLLYKADINPTSWKSYWRTIAVYSIIAAIVTMCADIDTVAAVIGVLIITDALIGLESRHLAYTLAEAP